MLKFPVFVLVSNWVDASGTTDVDAKRRWKGNSCRGLCKRMIRKFQSDVLFSCAFLCAWYML